MLLIKGKCEHAHSRIKTQLDCRICQPIRRLPTAYKTTTMHSSSLYVCLIPDLQNSFISASFGPQPPYYIKHSSSLGFREWVADISYMKDNILRIE